MYARVTSFKIDPSRLAELADRIKDLRPAAQRLSGVVSIHAMWRSDGQGVVTAIYRSKADADAAVRRMQVLWGALATLLDSAPRTDIYEHVEHVAGRSADPQATR